MLTNCKKIIDIRQYDDYYKDIVNKEIKGEMIFMSKEIKMSKKIKSIRVLNGDTLESLSKDLGITIGTLCAKENGKSKFTLEEARFISLRYKMRIEEIFF